MSEGDKKVNQLAVERTIYVVDDDEKVCKLLDDLFTNLDYSVKTFTNALDFFADFPLGDLGCILLDLRLPVMGGLQIQQEIYATDCHLPIIFMTSHADNRSAVKAIKAGAFDFVDKPINFQEILDITQTAMRHCEELNEESKYRESVFERLNQLTAREKEICKLLGTGSTTKQTAYKLDISQRTAEVHRYNIMKKLGVSSIAELTRLLLVTDDQLFDEINLSDRK